MEDKNLMSRDELRALHPHYDNLPAVEKLMLDMNEHTAAGEFTRNAAKGLEYVMAAKTIGSSDRQILFNEILPNLINQVKVLKAL